MNFQEFRVANVKRSLRWHPAGINSWSLSDWMTALAGEVGEAAGVIKMMNRERDGLAGNKFHPLRSHLADELADVFTYLDLLAEAAGIDLEEATRRKFNAVSDRLGFPDKLE